MNHQDPNTTEILLTRLGDGDRSALSPLIALHRNYLKRVVESRMEEDLRRRIDPSDEQLSMGRHVALKILPMAGALQENSLQRFRNEVRAASILDHLAAAAIAH